MTWASRRQTIIISGIAIILIIIFFPILKPIIAPTATCFDNKKNQGELDTDCSGPCQKICKFEAVNVTIQWARPFEVAPGVYSAVAYLSNPNPYFEARNVPYTMRVYDDGNILLAERTGKINIPAKSALPVFVGGMSVDKLKVQQASFELKGDLDWQRNNKEPPKIKVSSPVVTTEGQTKVTVTITNHSLDLLKNLPIIAIVYDKNANAIAASNTVVDRLAKNESAEISFTWLLPFTTEVGRVEIYPDTMN